LHRKSAIRRLPGGKEAGRAIHRLLHLNSNKDNIGVAVKMTFLTFETITVSVS
jgi:hypothetical protein